MICIFAKSFLGISISFFAKLAAPNPIQRASWTLEIDDPLHLSPDDPEMELRKIQAPDLAVSRVTLRVDWQTLRRMPVSGGLLFNFKTSFTPLPALREEPYIPALAHRVLTQGPEQILKYKNTWYVEHVALPALERYEREQVENGMVEEGWEVQTLDNAPFYPGWEEKWRSKQGF